MKINIKEPLKDNISMKIELDIPQGEILDFLKYMGYSIEAYHLELPAQEEILVSEPSISEWTFVALKDGEPPNENNLYLKVLEKEIKSIFNDI